MKKYLKSSLLSLGAMSAVVAPIASSISCGKNNKVTSYRLLPTYAGQADQLIALGIKADYYPWQLSQHAPFTYLTDAGQFISDSQNTTWKAAFAAKVKSLIPDHQQTAWWNQQALEDGEKGSDPEYWTHIRGDLVLYEHYLLDDGAKAIDSAIAPKHTDKPSTFIQTNFRQSRDPFTRMTKNIIEGLLDKDAYAICSEDEKKFIGQMLDVARNVEGIKSGEESGAVDGKGTPAGAPKNALAISDEDSWIYNDYNFARVYHTQFLDNDQFKNSQFSDIVLDSTKQWVFDKDPAKNAALAKVFYNSTYVAQESKLKAIMTGASNQQLSATAKLDHHPIYDQQTEMGAAPMFEGAMRDNSLYIYDLSSKLQKASTNALNDQAGYDMLKASFEKDDAGKAQWEKMQHAFDNAEKIERDLKARYAKIKVLVDKLKNKTFGLVTVAPGASGVSTIQSNSKYSFLYREMGFDQPLPTVNNDLNLLQPADGGTGKGTDGARGDTLFNMDDNGWWWNISQQDSSGKSTGIDTNKTQQFTKFDYGVLAANQKDFDAASKSADRVALASLWKNQPANLSDVKVDYNLWNEGLKTPFVIHMMLDHIVDLIKKDTQDTTKLAQGASAATNDEIKAAYNWGDYFTKDYIA